MDGNFDNYYLTADEAVQLLGCSKRTLRRYVSQGLIGKIGKGRGTMYSGISVIMLNRHRGVGKIDKLINQLKVISDTQQEIITRLTLLESLFMPRGGTVTLDDEEAARVKVEIRNALKRDIGYEECRDWAEELLKLSEDSCRKIGFSLLNDMAKVLIAVANQLIELKRVPKKRVLLERLKWFENRLKTFSSLAPSEG